MAQAEYAQSAEIQWVRPRRGMYGRVLRLIRRQPLMIAGAVVIIAVSLAAILAPALGLPKPNEVDVTQIRLPPSSDHLLGTDRNGRDQLARIIHGGRVSLAVAFFGVLAGTAVGGVWGLISGYFRGKVDLLSERVVEIMLAVPGILLAFVLAALLGPGLKTVLIAIAALNVGQAARVVRGVTLSAREYEYVTAARSVGARWPRLIALHVAPTAIAPFLIVFSAQVGFGILTEATLGFLGVGVPPPNASWGSLVAEPFANSRTPPWWLVVYPGLVISLVVLAFNMVGDGLRDELDPRLRGGQ